MAGVDMVHVPYKGAGPALVDVMGGHVPIMFDNLPSSTEHIKAGKLRGLAVTTAERAASMPDLPTVAESGLPGYETYTWNALFAPAGTPPGGDREAERGRRHGGRRTPACKPSSRTWAPRSSARRRSSWPSMSRRRSPNGRRWSKASGAQID